MGKKKFTGKAKEKEKPKYYRKNRLTVGMLQDLCARIPDKSIIVEMSDRTGNFPEHVLRGILITGPKGQGKGLVLAAKFSWTADDGDIPNDEADEPSNLEEAMCSAVGEACSTSTPQGGDCVALRKGLSYLTSPEEGADATHSPAPK